MESSEQGNNWKRKNAEKMAENRKMESSEQGNNWKRKNAEKMAETRHLNNIQKGLKKCLSILEAKKMGIIEKI
jgi:lantibiotic modifying enzyme